MSPLDAPRRVRGVRLLPAMLGATLLAGVPAHGQNAGRSESQRGDIAVDVTRDQLERTERLGSDAAPANLGRPQARSRSQRGDDLLRPRDDTVLTRDRPAYDPVGLRAGGFTLFPAAGLNTTFDSNIRATRDPQADVYLDGRVSLRGRSNWSRHALLFDSFVSQRVHANFSSEDGTEYRARATGQLDIVDRSLIELDVRGERVIVPRRSTSELPETRRPIRYDLSSGRVEGVFRANRLSARLSGSVAQYNYLDSERFDGAPSDQNFRDFDRYLARLDTEYAFSPARALFVSVEGEQRRYPSPRGNIVRDADGVEVIAGIRGEVTPLIRGQIGLGYLYQNYRQAGIDSINALGVDVMLDYLVTRLTTVSARVERTVENVAAVDSPASLVTRGRLRADHELLRNVLLRGGVEYEYSDFRASPQARKVSAVDVGADWLINRRLRATGTLRGGRGTSSGGGATDRTFTEVNVSAGLSFRL